MPTTATAAATATTATAATTTTTASSSLSPGLQQQQRQHQQQHHSSSPAGSGISTTASPSPGRTGSPGTSLDPADPNAMLSNLAGGLFAGLAAAFVGGATATAHTHEIFSMIDSVFLAQDWDHARAVALNVLGLSGPRVLASEVKSSFLERAKLIMAGTNLPLGTNSIWLDMLRLTLSVEVIRHVKGTGAAVDVEMIVSPPSSRGAGSPMSVGGRLGEDAPFRLDADQLRDRVGALLEVLLGGLDIVHERPGLTHEEIDECCPVQKRAGSDDGDCPICLEPGVKGEAVRKLSCGHCFHRECIEAWLSTAATCPTCRSAIKPAHRRENA
mmetsp:Transcript_4008/g.9209  ORF Transcript_4008/g.9209 Transcript_4008/m.9209 type:complete len:328 (+) Transcript_4008:6-989(+)